MMAVMCWRLGMSVRGDHNHKHGTPTPCLSSCPVPTQTYFRMSKARSEYLEARRLVMAVQAAWRGRNARERFAALRRAHAALCIQRWWRMAVARKGYQTTVSAAVALQCAWRVRVAKHELRTLRQSARESTKLLEDKKMLEAKVGFKRST